MPFLAVDIYRSVATFPINYSRAAAIGTLLFWISLIGVAFYRYASRVATRFVTVTARGYGCGWSGCGAGAFRPCS